MNNSYAVSFELIIDADTPEEAAQKYAQQVPGCGGLDIDVYAHDYTEGKGDFLKFVQLPKQA